MRLFVAASVQGAIQKLHNAQTGSGWSLRVWHFVTWGEGEVDAVLRLVKIKVLHQLTTLDSEVLVFLTGIYVTGFAKLVKRRKVPARLLFSLSMTNSIILFQLQFHSRSFG